MMPQQQACLRAIDRLTVDGVSPSYDDLKIALGLASKSGVARLIEGLEARGYIRRLPNRARSIEIINRPEWLVAKAEGELDTAVRALVAVHGFAAVEAALFQAGREVRHD